jgi:predicted ATPase
MLRPTRCPSGIGRRKYSVSSRTEGGDEQTKPIRSDRHIAAVLRQRAEVCQLLAQVYGWFTEGFDTADLQEAKALLEIPA